MSSKSGILDPLRVRIRRFQFIVGLGFLAMVIGTMATSSLAFRLTARVQELPWEPLRVFIGVVVGNLWVLGALPLLCYAAARVLELKPLGTALGAAFTGKLFLVALSFVSAGIEGVWGGWMETLLHLAAFAGGVVLSHRAVARARASATQAAARAQAEAEARKVEYLEFLREAERGGEKTAQREAERAPAVAAAGGAALAVVPEGAAPATSSPDPTPEATKPAPTEGQD